MYKLHKIGNKVKAKNISSNQTMHITKKEKIIIQPERLDLKSYNP